MPQHILAADPVLKAAHVYVNMHVTWSDHHRVVLREWRLVDLVRGLGSGAGPGDDALSGGSPIEGEV